MRSRIRVLNTLPIGAEDADKMGHLSDRLDIHNLEMSTNDLDATHDDRVEVLLAPRGPRPLERMPRLKWLQLPSAGADHLAGDPIFGRAIVTNARGVYATPLAEYIMWAILDYNQKGSGRRVAQAARRWLVDDPTVSGTRLRGQTVGIVGYGAVGREVARLASSFGMTIIAVKARPDLREDNGFRAEGTGDPSGVIPREISGIDALTKVASHSDVIVNTLPLTDKTREIISAGVLRALPSHALLVNVGRGATVDETALLEALDADRLGAAYLDVFLQEPLPRDHPFWTHDKITVTTHISGSSDGHMLYQLFAENLLRYLRGEALINVISSERGY